MAKDVEGESGYSLSLGDLGGASIAELVSWRNQIDAELKARGHVRTASSMVGEIMERVVADAYMGELAQPGARSADVVLPDGRRIQVKTRSLPPGDLRHWAFGDLDFDLAVVIKLDRDTADIDWARELSQDEVGVLARPHGQDGLRLRMAAARSAGRDVTYRLREAYSALE